MKSIYDDIYFIPLYRRFLDALAAFRKVVEQGDETTALSIEKDIKSLFSQATSDLVKTDIRKAMSMEAGTQLKWIKPKEKELKKKIHREETEEDGI